MDVVGVHGIAQQQRGRHQLITAWAPALADGLEATVRRRVAVPRLDMAFYGDFFLSSGEIGTKVSRPDAGDALLEGAGPDEVVELRGLACELLSEAEIASAADAARDKGFGRIPLPLQAAAKALDRRFGHRGAGVLLLGEFRQVRRYLLDPGLKERVDARTKEAATGCRLLIGHSLGSVVAFEYIRQNPNHHLDLLLTLGSPLALRVIRELMPDAGFGGAGLPPNVAVWVNVRDPRDPVAVAGPLSIHWTGIKDVIVNNEKSAHAVERYLSKAEVGEAILAVMPGLAS
jgi:hypothetical protein